MACSFKEFVEPKSSRKFSIKTFRMFFPVACRRTHISFYPTCCSGWPVPSVCHAFCYCSSFAHRTLARSPPSSLSLSLSCCPPSAALTYILAFSMLASLQCFSFFVVAGVVVAAAALILPLLLLPHSSPLQPPPLLRLLLLFFDINLKLFSFIVADSLAVMDFK